jgi:hypothetical protein
VVAEVHQRKVEEKATFSMEMAAKEVAEKGETVDCLVEKDTLMAEAAADVAGGAAASAAAPPAIAPPAIAPPAIAAPAIAPPAIAPPAIAPPAAPAIVIAAVTPAPRSKRKSLRNARTPSLYVGCAVNVEWQPGEIHAAVVEKIAASGAVCVAFTGTSDFADIPARKAAKIIKLAATTADTAPATGPSAFAAPATADEMTPVDTTAKAKPVDVELLEHAVGSSAAVGAAILRAADDELAGVGQYVEDDGDNGTGLRVAPSPGLRVAPTLSAPTRESSRTTRATRVTQRTANQGGTPTGTKRKGTPVAEDTLCLPDGETGYWVKGLTVPLRTYQYEALLWMLHEETANNGMLRCFWSPFRCADGRRFFYSPLQGMAKDACSSFGATVMNSTGLQPLPPMTRGCLLAEQMGLGKTIETVALILCNPRSAQGIGKQVSEHTMATSLTIEQQEQRDEELARAAVAATASRVSSSSSSASASASGSGGGSSNSGSDPVQLHKPLPKWHGGTLVVCMVSLVGQWIDEIQSKLSGDAACSIQCYHGGNRKKNPELLSRSDVVVTTYSILQREKKDGETAAAQAAEEADWHCDCVLLPECATADMMQPGMPIKAKRWAHLNDSWQKAEVVRKHPYSEMHWMVKFQGDKMSGGEAVLEVALNVLKRPEPEWVSEYERSKGKKGSANSGARKARGGGTKAGKLKVKKEKAAATTAASAATASTSDDAAPPRATKCGHLNRGRTKCNGSFIKKCTHCGAAKPLRKITEQLYESKHRPACESMVWHRIVLDESHSIKSPDAGTSQAVLKLTGDMRLCVTGTPVNTAVSDLYNQLRFLGLKPLVNKSNFEREVEINMRHTNLKKIDTSPLLTVGEEVQVYDGALYGSKRWKTARVSSVKTSVDGPSNEKIYARISGQTNASDERAYERSQVKCAGDENQSVEKTKVFSFKIWGGDSDDVIYGCLESDLGLTMKCAGCTGDACPAGHPSTKDHAKTATTKCDVCSELIPKTVAWQMGYASEISTCKQCNWWCCQTCGEKPVAERIHVIDAVAGEGLREGLLPSDVITHAVVDGHVVSAADMPLVSAEQGEQLIPGTKVLFSQSASMTACLQEAIVLGAFSPGRWNLKRLSDGKRMLVAFGDISIIDGQSFIPAKIEELIAAAKRRTRSAGGEVSTAVEVALTIYRAAQWPSTVTQTVEQQALNGMRRLAGAMESRSNHGGWNVHVFR